MLPHTYPHNPTLRRAYLQNGPLPKGILKRQNEVLARPFAGYSSSNPPPIKDLIQKKRRGESTTNYLESIPWQFGGKMKQTPY